MLAILSALAILVVLARQEQLIRSLSRLGDCLMAQNAEVLAFLDKLDEYTTKLAAAQTAQTAKIEEIAADIDRLITEGGLDPATVARLQTASDGLAATVAFEEAQAATLTAIAAKSDVPLPPPAPPQ